MTGNSASNQLYLEWERLEREWQELHALYFSTGTPPVKAPPRMLTPEALDEIHEKRIAAGVAYKAYLDALR